MGLDITAYGQLKPTDKSYDPNTGEYDYETETTFWDTESRAPELIANTIYTFGDSFAFRAGSYSGYNEWRNELAKMAGLGSAQEVWDSIEVRQTVPYPPQPFEELINFSDCEGTIGAAVAAKLLGDFRRYAEKARNWLTGQENEWFFGKYKEWLRAFELASRDGAVKFS